MFNPLSAFRIDMLPGFATMQVRYLVAQEYCRGKMAAGERLPLLLTDYQHLPDADIHYQKIRPADKWAAMIDLENIKHRDKLREMCQPDSVYMLFAAFIDHPAKAELKHNKKIVSACRYFIDTETDWRPKKEDTIKAILGLHQGELMMTFQLGRKQSQTTLMALENCRPPAPTLLSPAVYSSYRFSFQFWC